MLSVIVNDPKLIKATKNMLRVIIRRPHAYKFRRDHPKAAIPCLAIMNGAGKLLGGTEVPSAKAVETLLELIDRHAPAKKSVVR